METTELEEERKKIEQTLGALDQPADLPKIVRIEYSLGKDATEKDAVWVWLVLDDATPENQWEYEVVGRLADAVRQKLREGGVTALIYVRFRSASEQEELKEFVPPDGRFERF